MSDATGAGDAPSSPGAKLNSETYFTAEVAHYFILGSSLFSIFWGIINALLVSIVLLLLYQPTWCNNQLFNEQPCFDHFSSADQEYRHERFIRHRESFKGGGRRRGEP